MGKEYSEAEINRGKLFAQAVVDGDWQNAAALLQIGIDPTQRIEDEDPPLMELIQHKQKDLALKLIEAGAPLDSTNNHGWMPAHCAAAFDQIDILQTLIEKKAPLNEKEKRCGYTPMHLAAMTGKIAIVQALIAAKAPLDVQDTYGQTPLHLAVSHYKKDVVETLVDARAILNIQDYASNTPLHIAAQGKSLDLAEYMLSAGADPNIRNKANYRPQDMTTDINILSALASFGAYVPGVAGNIAGPWTQRQMESFVEETGKPRGQGR